MRASELTTGLDGKLGGATELRYVVEELSADSVESFPIKLFSFSLFPDECRFLLLYLVRFLSFDD